MADRRAQTHKTYMRAQRRIIYEQPNTKNIYFYTGSAALSPGPATHVPMASLYTMRSKTIVLRNHCAQKLFIIKMPLGSERNRGQLVLKQGL